MDAVLSQKYAKMLERLGALESVAIAFSAGVDSTFVLKVAIDVLGCDNVLAVTGRSASIPSAELAEAEQLANSIGARHEFIDTDEFSNPQYTANPTNRCYHCKTSLFTMMGGLLERFGVRHIVSGTNADDLGDWRPGLTAASEHEVVAPVAEAGLTKADVRALSQHLGLPTSDKPASPCLSSRVPYGHEVTPDKLRAIEAGERYLRATFNLRECRVRHYGDFARIEIPVDRLGEFDDATTKTIAEHFRHIGFSRVEVDPRGFRSGSLNDVIAFGERQAATPT